MTTITDEHRRIAAEECEASYVFHIDRLARLIAEAEERGATAARPKPLVDSAGWPINVGAIDDRQAYRAGLKTPD